MSVETCPHYLTFDAEHIADGATELKCCPPIREADNREALWAAWPRATSTSWSPTTRRAPPTSSARAAATSARWGGIASVQLGLPAVWTDAMPPHAA